MSDFDEEVGEKKCGSHARFFDTNEEDITQESECEPKEDTQIESEWENYNDIAKDISSSPSNSVKSNVGKREKIVKKMKSHKQDDRSDEVSDDNSSSKKFFHRKYRNSESFLPSSDFDRIKTSQNILKSSPRRENSDESEKDSHRTSSVEDGSQKSENFKLPNSDTESNIWEKTSTYVNSPSSRGECKIASVRNTDDEAVNLESSDSENETFYGRKQRKTNAIIDSDEDVLESTEKSKLLIRSDEHILEAREVTVPNGVHSNNGQYFISNVHLKSRKYQLLNDGDILDADHSDGNTSICDENGSNLTEKQKRTKKLQKLNNVKKRETEKHKKCKKKAKDSSSSSAVSPNSNKNKEVLQSANDNLPEGSLFTPIKKKRKLGEQVRKSTSTGEKMLKRSKRKSKKDDTMLEIKSVTQKMIREGRISLPYHQPKQRSLDEFLQRRRKIVSMPLKSTSSAFLKLMHEHLTSKEKEVTEFYKSESEHSEDECTDKNQNFELQQTSSEAKIDSIVIPCQKADEMFEKCVTTENIIENERGEQIGGCSIENSAKIASSAKSSNQRGSENALIHASSSVEAVIRSTVQVTDFAEKQVSDVSLPKQETANLDDNDKIIETDDIDLSSIVDGNSVREFSKTCDLTCDIINILQHPEVCEFSQKNVPMEIENSILNKTCLDAVSKDNVLGNDKTDFILKTDSSSNYLDSPNAEDLRLRKLALLSKLNVEIPPAVSFDKDEHQELQFEIGTVQKSGVEKLMEKFAQHAAVEKKSKKRNAETVSFISARTNSQGEIIDVVKETLSLSSSNESKDDTEKFSVPGSKYSVFKDIMLKALLTRKEAHWKEYQREKQKLYDENDSEDEEYFEDIESKKLYFEPEPYHPEDEPNDEELTEDDVDLEDDDPERNEFLDDEADVSDEDEEEFLHTEKEVPDHESVQNTDEDCDNVEDADADNQSVIHSDDNSLTNVEGEVNKIRVPEFSEKLFTNELSGEDLERKLLGLNSICSQNNGIPGITNSQIFSLCSGKFITQLVQPNADTGDSQFLVEDSQNFNLSMEDINDEDVTSELNCTLVGRNYSLLMSDESDTEELFISKKIMQPIQDSSDEDESNNFPETANERESQKEECETDLDEEEKGENLIEYNSEEEMITSKSSLKPSYFFENEAELSESDWSSEDENEKGLDELEREAGDDDVIDVDQLKMELEKIHMRQLLDDDQKDVRLLKEMLLEDGELHSNSKRRRKFQWKNSDGEDFFLKVYDDSDDDNVFNEDNDAELQENWRKIRHERETFLSQQEKRNEFILPTEDEDNARIQVDKTKITTKSSNISTVDENLLSKSPSGKLPINVLHKCGSFLSRGKLLLNRLAVNVSTEIKDNNIRGARNSGNFVFATVGSVKKDRDLPNLPKTEKRRVETKLAPSKKLKLRNDSVNSVLPVQKSGLLAQLSLAD